MMKEQVHIFENCLQDYLAQGSAAAMAAYLEVDEDLLQEWKTNLPRGERFIRAAYFLKNAGYQVQELDTLPKPIFNFGKLIFTRLISVKEILSRYGHIFPSRDSVMDTFKRPHKFGPPRIQALETAYSEWLLQYPYLDSFPMPICPPIPSDEISEEKEFGVMAARLIDESPVPAQSEQVSVQPEQILNSFANLIQAATPLGMIILGDSISDKERYRLRTELLKGGKITEFADIINALTSEEARRALIERRKSSEVKRKENKQ